MRARFRLSETLMAGTRERISCMHVGVQGSGKALFPALAKARHINFAYSRNITATWQTRQTPSEYSTKNLRVQRPWFGTSVTTGETANGWELGAAGIPCMHRSRFTKSTLAPGCVYPTSTIVR